MLIQYGIVIASCTYSSIDGTWKSCENAASHILSNLTNAVMIFQYVNIVKMMKQGYKM